MAGGTAPGKIVCATSAPEVAGGWSGNRRHEMLTHVQASLLHLRREDKRERHWGR